jgi:hypothetical protein
LRRHSRQPSLDLEIDRATVLVEVAGYDIDIPSDLPTVGFNTSR